ncbi:MAG: hypothetical protein IT445_00260 [Phycisphaeraceae bacterium]|nr:hypothetical protein [Phycisphaeraceae bacterium]
MSEDQTTYQRAMTAALAGLLTQVVLTVVMGLLGLYSQSPALHAAALHFLGGVPIWIILAILFHQQKQERVEALEAEQLAEADARSAAIFNEAGEQLRYARKRLANLVKWWLNIVSLGVAAYLLTVGGIYLWRAYKALQDQSLQVNAIGVNRNMAVLTVVGVAVAFVAFLVARYVAGMTKVRAWQPLRGGAGYLMGCAVVAMLLVAAAAYAYLGSTNDGFVWAAVVIPAMMVLLGIEIVLSFTFGMYRPRKPGEAPKPAFESRLLGWLTRPESIGKIIGETINYQFGFEISASWFYRLLSKAITPLIVLGVLVLVGLSSLVIVGPHQNAVITRFGAFESVQPPGAHFKLPWPIDRVEKYDVYKVQSIDVATGELQELKPDVAILWTNQHAGEEKTFFVTPEPIEQGLPPEGEHAAASPDQTTSGGAGAIAAGQIGARVTIQYRINDLEQYVRGDGTAEKPEQLLQRQAERVVTEFFATHNTDNLLSMSRVDADGMMVKQLKPAAEKLGLEVLTAAITSLHPPQEGDVAKAFLKQIDADIQKQAAIEDAEKDAVTTLTQVAGSRQMAMKVADAIREADSLLTRLNAVRSANNYDAAEASRLSDALAQQQADIEKLMDEAGGEAVGLIYQARAYRWQHAMGERARAMRTLAKMPLYQQAPRYYRTREYLNALRQSMQNGRKIVLTTPDAEEATVRLQLEDQTVNLGVFDSGQ